MNDLIPRFTYGDKVRRKNDRRVLTVHRIGSKAYYFTDGTFALIADQDCYDIVEKASGYFLVAKNLDGAPLDDHVQHGYEERQMFVEGLRKLTSRWGGRVGLNVGERNGFLLLRFYDIPGGGSEEKWLPLYLLTPTDMPDYMRHDDDADDIEAELDAAFGFD